MANRVMMSAATCPATGSIAATGLVITELLSSHVTPAGATDPVTDTQNGQILVWTSQGPIAPAGGTIVITIPVTVNANVPNGTSLTNTATVKYENSAGWVFATEAATDTTSTDAPVLAISKSDFPDPVLAGRPITYTLYYTNSGPAAATNVFVTDTVPQSTTYVAGSCSTTSCDLIGSTVVFTIGTLAGNSSGAVSFSALVSDTVATGTQIRNEEYGILADQANFSGTLVETLVNRSTAFFEGYTFVDADGDGVYDAGENPSPGITVTLSNATVPLTKTNSVGYYRFRVETAGPISVTATPTSTYFRTTPGTVYTDSALGITQTINFGYAPVTSTFGTIYGTVFEDDSHDGIQNGGESGIPGVTVTSAGAVTPTLSTNSLGQYTFRYSISGTTTSITETNPQFYVSTTPDVVTTGVITRSSNASPIDFGDFMCIKIAGIVFDDADIDGVRDPAETSVAGATVAVTGDSFATGGTGVYTLYATLSSSSPILVSETDPAGYLSTNAVPGTGMSRVDANTLRIDGPISGTVYTGGEFGDVLATANVITISGYVWDDNGAGGGTTNDGVWDNPLGGGTGAEPGLAGAIVRLSSGMTQTTGSNGSFALYGPANVVITVTEANPTGYASTNAISGSAQAIKIDNDTLVVSALASGTTLSGNLFGDTLIAGTALITGTVFDDANTNSVLDGGETGLHGVRHYTD